MQRAGIAFRTEIRAEEPVADIGGNERVSENVHRIPLFATSLGPASAGTPDTPRAVGPTDKGLSALRNARPGAHTQYARTRALGCSPNLPQGFE